MSSLTSIHYLQHHVNGYVKNQLPSIANLLNLINLHVGEYKWTSRNGDYNGWFLCDGRSLSRTTHTALFDIIGTAFGTDSEETFKLPDYRGRVMGAIGTGLGLTPRELGSCVGAERHTLSASEMPSHTHTGTTQQGGIHSHTATSSMAGGHSHGGFTGLDGQHTHTTNSTSGTLGLVSANGQSTTTTMDGDGPAGELNLATSPTAVTINNSTTHTHSIAAAPNHDHAITVADSVSHSHTFTTESAGSGQSHNNMQPTLFGGNVFIFTGVTTSVAPEIE